MKGGWFIMSVLLCTGLAVPASAGEVLRIGHTTLSANTNAGGTNLDSGLYAALIDASNGYAYFTGNYVSKVNLASNLPVQIGPGLLANHALQSAIDPAAGYLYLPRGTVLRFALGAGTNVMSSAGSLSPSFGSAAEMLVDDSDPNPTNHYGYLLCTSGAVPARVSKVAMSPFAELNSIPLAASESNFLLYAVADPPKGYGYFVTTGGSNTAPTVVKVKFTPGTNAPVRIGAASLDATNAFVGGSSLDTLHGYAYYGANIADPNVPGMVCKVKLGAGDVAPSSVGRINLRAGEGRLASSVCDPANGFVYFADDNTYPGRLYQLALNGTNLPIEIGYTEMLGTTNAHPPNGTTAANFTTNADGVLPYGEVFFRSAVFDPLRGFAYLGQDSRPNQVVKAQVAQINPFALTGVKKLNGGSCQFVFTNIMGAPFSVLAVTNLSLPLSNWTSLGAVTDSPPGQYQFADPQAANGAQRFYRVSSP
jgi:hypothetical protein